MPPRGLECPGFSRCARGGPAPVAKAVQNCGFLAASLKRCPDTALFSNCTLTEFPSLSFQLGGDEEFLRRVVVLDAQHVLAAQQKLAARQLQYQRLVDRRNGEKLEGVQALDHRKTCLMNAAFGGPTLAVQQLLFCQTQQVARIVHALGGTLPRHFVVLAQESRQPQLLQVMFQQHLWSVRDGRVLFAAHRVTSLCKLSGDAESKTM